MEKVDKTDNAAYEVVNEIAGKFLGSGKTEYIEKYDPSLLVRFKRSDSLESSNIDINDKYYGVDVWNMWEVSFILNNGAPIHGVGKLVLPAESKYIVESKAMKLYFFSYAMEKMGDTIEEAISNFESRVKQDLEKEYELSIDFKFTQTFDVDTTNSQIVSHFQTMNAKFNILNNIDIININITDYDESPNILMIEDETKSEPLDDINLIRFLNYYDESNKPNAYMYAIPSIKSNCRVTSQADFANGYIIIESKNTFTSESIYKYITSFRNENHFHEECSHMIYDRMIKKLKEVDENAEIIVALLYTRRGGIDINPIRASSEKMLNKYSFITNLINIDENWVKTPQQ